MKPPQTYHTAATTFRDKQGYNKGVCQAVRTSDRPANPKPPPSPPRTPGVPPCGRARVQAKLSWREPSPLLSLMTTLSLPPPLPTLDLGTHTSFCWLWPFVLSFHFCFVHLPHPDLASPFSFPFEEMSLDKERIGGFSPR